MGAGAAFAFFCGGGAFFLARAAAPAAGGCCLAVSSGFSGFAATGALAGAGSGVGWDAEGHVVTNYHVVASGGGKSVKVKLQGAAEAESFGLCGLRGR